MAETRTEFVVFIPDETRKGGRREVSRYSEYDPIVKTGEDDALTHAANIRETASLTSRGGNNRERAFVVKQVITVEESPVPATPPTAAPPETPDRP